MKNILLLISIVMILSACSSKQSNKSTASADSSSTGSSSSSGSSSGGTSSSTSSSGGGGGAIEALLSGHPVGIRSTTNLSILVSGTGVVEYQYKYGDNSISCASSSGYSADVSIGTPIVENISSLSDGDVILCVVGKNASGTYQDFSSATSVTWTKDTTSPSTPSSPSIGASTAVSSESPILSWGAASDAGSSVASYQVQIYNSSNVEVGSPVTLASGNKVVGLSLTLAATYYFKIRAVDSAGNVGSYSVASSSWTVASSDPCNGTPSPGTSCSSGTIFLGTLSPGATSGSGTDKYMTTPGGCGEIPSDKKVSSPWGASGDYPNDFFTPTCSGTDSLQKFWNDGTASSYTIPGLTDPAPNLFTTGTGNWAVNLDPNYGSANTSIISAITSGAQGGYHAAALYCKYLSYGGFTDWYLPNLQELHLFYTQKDFIPGLVTSGTYYHSSSQSSYSGDVTWSERMSDGSQTYWNTKYNAELVRCVRRY